MPFPAQKVKGFGYVTGTAVEDQDDESEDSRLSSTSLRHTLIEPSSSEDWLWHQDEEEDDEQREISYTAVRQLSFFKRPSVKAAKEAGLLIDYKDVRERDKRRSFQSQVVPFLPQGEKGLMDRRKTFYSRIGLSMPLMQKLGMVDEERDETYWIKQSNLKGRKKIEGLVGDIINFLENKPKRAEYIRKGSRSGSVVRTRRQLTLLTSDVDPETFFTQETVSYDEYHAVKNPSDINIVYDKRASISKLDDQLDSKSDSDVDIESLFSASSISILKKPSLMYGARKFPKPRRSANEPSNSKQ